MTITVKNPPISPVTDYLGRLREDLLGLRDGEVADYIPELAAADPDAFAIALATTDGTLYSAGDCETSFTIQSISKPLVFGLALEDLGERTVLSKIDVEPSGEPFNSIDLGPDGRPPNPMVNAGAIAATALIAERDGTAPIDRIVALHSAYAGRELEIDTRTASSESATGERNRAIAHLLRAAGAIDGNPVAVVETYFKQCSIALNTRDAALIAATLAAGGVHPLTGTRVASKQTVRHVLSVMSSCGMYDGAGEWLYTVGLPAKSGVSGTIIAVLPGALGIAVHSPRLDANGNSVRGTAACHRLAHDLDLHLLGSVEQPPPIHHRFTLADVHSRRARPAAERETLTQVGSRALVLELRGELTFLSAELVSRALLDRAEPTDFAVIDISRVDRIEPIADRLLSRLAVTLADRPTELILVGAEGRRDDFPADVPPGTPTRYRFLDDALEYCEDRLLSTSGAVTAPTSIELSNHPALAGLDETQLERVLTLLERRKYSTGTEIVGVGERLGELHLLCDGRVSLALATGDGSPLRLASLLPGMTFGDIGFLQNTPSPLAVRADTDVISYALSSAQLDLGVERDPEIAAKLLLNLARRAASVSEWLRTEMVARAEL